MVSQARPWESWTASSTTSSRSLPRNLLDLPVTTRSPPSLQGKFRPRSGLCCPVNWPSTPSLRVPRLSPSSLALELTIMPLRFDLGVSVRNMFYVEVLVYFFFLVKAICKWRIWDLLILLCMELVANTETYIIPIICCLSNNFSSFFSSFYLFYYWRKKLKKRVWLTLRKSW